MKNEQKKLNNKGFSLVELIVVIAIMAILVGVLAPSVMGQIEKSRVSKDVQAVDAVRTAVMTAVADPTSYAAGFTGSGASYTAGTPFTLAAVRNAVTGGSPTAFETAIIDVVGSNQISFGSTTYASLTEANIYITVTAKLEVIVQVKDGANVLITLPEGSTT